MRLNHVTLAVRDLDRSVAFYRSLGLRQIVADHGYARFVSPEGDSTLSLESRGRAVQAEGFSVQPALEAQPVTAPNEALETVAAYLAITPRSQAGSGAW